MRFRSVKQLYWYTGIVLFLVVLHVIGVLRPLESAFRSVADAPITKVSAGMRGLVSWSRSDDTMHSDEEFQGVIRERDLLKTRVALVESENATLRRQLNYPTKKTWNTVGADIITKSADPVNQLLILNQGSSSNIAVGQAVVADQGVLLGRVARVEKDRSFVRLLDDRESRIGALHAETAHAIGIVEGGYGLGVRLSLIPPNEVLEVGDLVVSDDAIAGMPRGLLIGKISAVGREAYEPFQHALISPAISYEDVRHVLVIIEK